MKILTILILSFLLFFNNLGGIALWDPDEPRQAIMAREMMERKDYIHPYLNGKPYLEKPPFYPWMIIMATKLTGRLDEFSARLPAAISATLLLLITYLLGSMLLDKKGGLLSAAVLATNYQFLSNARESVMDMTFAFFIGLCIFLNYLAIKRDSRTAFIFSFIPASMAILTKGPAGLIIPAVTTFLYLLSQRKLKGFFLSFIAGCTLSLFIASIWFFLAGEEYFREFILRQNITRYTNAFDHIESSFYYFHKIFFNFLPWSIILPFSVYYAFKKRIYLPLIWFLFTFLFFEFSKSKRAIYLLPLYPAGALLCGIFIREKWSYLLKNKWVRIFVWIFGVIIALLPVASVFSFNFIPQLVANELRRHLLGFYVFMAILFTTALVFCYFILKRKHNVVIVMSFLYLTVMGVFYNNIYMPVMDRALKSPKLITDKIKNIEQYQEIYSYGFNSPGLIFYMGRPVKNLLDIKETKNKNKVLVIVEDEEVKEDMKKVLESEFSVAGKARYEKETYTFYVKI